MILINIAALIVAVAVVVLVITLIPLIRELKAASNAVRELVVNVETNILPTIRELNDALADLNVITAGAAEAVQEVKCFTSVVGDTGRSLRSISSIFGGVSGALAKSSLWLTGAKVAGSFMLDKMTKKGGR